MEAVVEIMMQMEFKMVELEVVMILMTEFNKTVSNVVGRGKLCLIIIIMLTTGLQ